LKYPLKPQITKTNRNAKMPFETSKLTTVCPQILRIIPKLLKNAQKQSSNVILEVSNVCNYACKS